LSFDKQETGSAGAATVNADAARLICSTPGADGIDRMTVVAPRPSGPIFD
jgi:hypothetical protein